MILYNIYEFKRLNDFWKKMLMINCSARVLLWCKVVERTSPNIINHERTRIPTYFSSRVKCRKMLTVIIP